MANANANNGSGDEQKKTGNPEQMPGGQQETAQPSKEQPGTEPASQQRPPSDS